MDQTTNINFFSMAISREISSAFRRLYLLPEQGKDFRDRHHVLELFRKKKATKRVAKVEEERNRVLLLKAL
jgi:hypothetical protein